jgi:hypothetical protein
MGEEALIFKPDVIQEWWGVYATGMGRRSRVLPWEICTRAIDGRTSPQGVAEVCRSQQRA